MSILASIYKIFSPKDHNHDSTYSKLGHTHTGLTPAAHTHTKSEITDFAHTHTLTELGAAASSHSHTLASLGAASSSHTHSYSDVGAAAASHSHSASDITGLTSVWESDWLSGTSKQNGTLTHNLNTSFLNLDIEVYGQPKKAAGDWTTSDIILLSTGHQSYPSDATGTGGIMLFASSNNDIGYAMGTDHIVVAGKNGSSFLCTEDLNYKVIIRKKMATV